MKMRNLLLLAALAAVFCVGVSSRIRRVAREPSTRRNSYFYHVNRGPCRGHYFHRSYARGQTTYFKCVQYEAGCHARAILSPERGFRPGSGEHRHSHEPDPLYPDEVALRRAILDRCRSLDYASYADIIDEEGRKLVFHVFLFHSYPANNEMSPKNFISCVQV